MRGLSRVFVGMLLAWLGQLPSVHATPAGRCEQSADCHRLAQSEIEQYRKLLEALRSSFPTVLGQRLAWEVAIADVVYENVEDELPTLSAAGEYDGRGEPTVARVSVSVQVGPVVLP